MKSCSVALLSNNPKYENLNNIKRHTQILGKKHLTHQNEGYDLLKLL